MPKIILKKLFSKCDYSLPFYPVFTNSGKKDKETVHYKNPTVIFTRRKEK